MNQSIKSLKAHLAKIKNLDPHTLLEYEIAFQNNNQRGHVWSQVELKELYPRWGGDAKGASKTTFLTCHDGMPFNHIVVKRMKTNCSWALGNQCQAEYDFWRSVVDTADADFFCPVFRCLATKSDHNNPNGATAIENIVLISQRAEKVGPLRSMCQWAEAHGGQDADERYDDLLEVIHRLDVGDVHGGNCGVIFDYATGQYKAVIIDYAL